LKFIAAVFAAEVTVPVDGFKLVQVNVIKGSSEDAVRVPVPPVPQNVEDPVGVTVNEGGGVTVIVIGILGELSHDPLYSVTYKVVLPLTVVK
jgi:hypothetical protein